MIRLIALRPLRPVLTPSSRRSSRTRLSVAVSCLLVSLGALSGCSDDESTSIKGTADTVTAVDGGVDGAGSSDAAAGGDVAAKQALGWVYESDPVTDNGKTKQVLLPPIISQDGTLTGSYAEVRNCLRKEGGAPLEQQGFSFGSLCVEEATAKQGADGSWLAFNAPEDASDPGDAFAEVQMYYHVHQMHDFFKGDFGLVDLDYPLYALVNVSLYINEELGGILGQTGWTGFPNAAFMPKEAFAQFGLPERESGAIVFGQYDDLDFSYDASVIYHEYTHAMVGTTRLLGTLVDAYGLDNLPGAMNEGFADYFAASFRNSPVIGAYALTAFPGQNLDRDVSKFKKCPDDLITEVHADGKIIGSTLWALRQELTQPVADGIVLKALQSFTQQTNMEMAGKFIIAEAKEVSEEAMTKTKAVLEKHGFVGCIRAKEWTNFYAQSSEEGLPYAFESKQSLQGGGGASFPDGLPGFVQFYVNVPNGAKAVRLSWQVQAGGGGGGFGGGGGGQAKLGVAVQRDKAVSLNLFGGGTITAEAKAEPAVASGGNQQVTLAGKCLETTKGRVYVMLLNKGSSAQVPTMEIEVLNDTSTAKTLITCD
jgi:hypothetical protein